MGDTAKIEIKIGEITFSGEGRENWLSGQADKFLRQAKELVGLAPARPASVQPPTSPAQHHGDRAAPQGEHSRTAVTPANLATFLKDTLKSKSSQSDKFLAVAVWLHGRGQGRLQTKTVSDALKKHNQKKLSNPSHCLNVNRRKGFCDKDGQGFYVTEEGRTHMGSFK